MHTAPWPRGRVLRVPVLRSDPDLSAELGEDRRAQADGRSLAVTLRRPTGSWKASADADLARDGFGLLILDGLLVRRVGFEERFGAELLGAGDILQPALHDGEQATLPFEATWRVIAPVRLAILDRAWATRMAPYPEVAIALHRRALVRSRRLATMQAIAQHRRLEERLLLFFWEVADRFGRVRMDGVVLEVPLTHELISHLVGARRPSVSAALSRLECSGRVARHGRSWLLLGTPPSAEELVDDAGPG